MATVSTSSSSPSSTIPVSSPASSLSPLPPPPFVIIEGRCWILNIPPVAFVNSPADGRGVEDENEGGGDFGSCIKFVLMASDMLLPIASETADGGG